ncbi:MAG TPA: CoA transferase [Acidimicrobiales bacterium]|jgi:crotonobetainyl-CoA:carnitine CoA-transferase CaiB-like acyl-CoA transferase|nr:CoA transferase [Acidimicrobiales bacterium]
MLENVRVVDLTTDIAGPYCTKVLADAGADVVKVEPASGDPLRQWGSGALFEFLNTSKRSVNGKVDRLIAGADILVTDAPVDLGDLWSTHRTLVVVTITPFGCEGPWVNHPTTEFTLQAACGSTGQRGLPEQPPLAAGGRIGEWVTGTYAALGAVAAYREAARCGEGDHVDVAMLDCMAVTMVTYPSVFASFAGWPPLVGTGRTIEVPSIEPTADGFAVFTTNSAQQFHDFLVMIGRTDLLADPDLPQVSKRFARRDEFLAAVRGYTSPRTTAEMLEAASLFRIPAGPVLDGSTLPEFEQFVSRGVFEKSPSGRFLQPRVPFRISGAEARPFQPAAENGEHTGTVEWPSVDRTEGDEADDGWHLPLNGVRVVDCTAWWAGPAATSALACLGADVIKVESASRPDLMRFAGGRPPTDDRWWEWGPLFHGVNTGKRAITLDLNRPEGIETFEQLITTADVLVENYTPRVMEQFGLDWDRLHQLNPDLIVVRMPAFGLDGPWRDRTGFAQTMECLSGMAWLTGFADGPPVLVRGACDPLAGMHSVIATLLALIERDQSGGGRLVESVMVEAALNAAAEQVLEFGATGAVLRRDGNRGPVAAPQGVYPCAGEDRWVAIAVATDQQWLALCRVLGDPTWTGVDAMAYEEGRRRLHDLIDQGLAGWTADRDADQTARLLVEAGVPAAAVIPPRDIAANPQLRSRSLFEVEHHPLTGDHEIPMLPFRFSRVERWLRCPAPTLGQDNDEVLGEIGLSLEAIERLRQSGIVGERLVGT